MRLPSLYGFYKFYFGYPTTGKVHYALAIRDTYKKIQEAYDAGDESVITNYRDEKYARQLTIGFLNNFASLGDHHYNKPMLDLQYITNSIRIHSADLGGKKRLDIDFGYCYDAKDQRLIFLEFGKLDDVVKWYPIFNTLITSFSVAKPLPTIKRVTCWDLSKGTTFEEDYSNIGVVPRDKVISVAKKIISA